jgi:cell division protein FtsQ
VTGRRRKRSAAARIRPFWMSIALLGLVAAAVIGVAATWPGFEAKDVEVVGNERVSSNEILRHADITRRRSIWLQNLGGVARRIQSIPYIAAASVHRIPPRSIRISVTERVPFAVLQSGPERVVVDRGLRVLEPASADERRPVLIVPAGLALWPGKFVTTRDAITLRDAYEAMLLRRITPSSLAFDRYGGLVVTLHDGLRVLLGQEGDLVQKLTLVEAILAQVVRAQRRITTIDVRAPSTPVVVYR